MGQNKKRRPRPMVMVEDAAQIRVGNKNLPTRGTATLSPATVTWRLKHPVLGEHRNLLWSEYTKVHETHAEPHFLLYTPCQPLFAYSRELENKVSIHSQNKSGAVESGQTFHRTAPPYGPSRFRSVRGASFRISASFLFTPSKFFGG